MNKKVDRKKDAGAHAAKRNVAGHAQEVAGNGRPLLDLAPGSHPDISHLITEDGKPVDNIFVEKQYKLLTEPLENSWRPAGRLRSFLTATNVGLFFVPRNPALVPDFLLSLGVTWLGDRRKKESHSYFVWLYGKPPDVVGEIVSDRRGGEDKLKLRVYASHGIRYYWIFDPDNLLRAGVLRVFELTAKGYGLVANNWLDGIGLGLTLWQGKHAGIETEWLRWQDKAGRLIPTGRERAEREKRRAEHEKQRAKDLAEKLKRAEAALRAAGLEPPT